MFSRVLRPSLVAARNIHTTNTNNFKVAVAGAAGGIGQPLSLLLKESPLVTKLNLFDVAKVTPGVAVDLSHIETPAQVKGYAGPDNMKTAFEGCDVVVIPAGVPRKPGMTRDDLFNTNATIVRDICQAIASVAPQAMVLIISNPVNSTVPIASAVFEKAGKYDPNRIFGVTTLDVVRANTFVSELKGLDVSKTKVPVVGGHSGITIIPLLSQVQPKTSFSQQELDQLTPRIQEAGTEVVKAKDGGGSATLSMAFAAARFTTNVLKAMGGEKNIVECTYIKCDKYNTKYFAVPVVLGPCGVQEVLDIGKISPYEEKLIEKAIPALQAEVKKGEEFMNKGSC